MEGVLYVALYFYSSIMLDMDFCLVQRRMEIEKSWSGKGLSRLRELSSTGETVHRLKVDESAGLVITTHREGGLRVTDLWRDEVLWSLSKASSIFVC